MLHFKVEPRQPPRQPSAVAGLRVVRRLPRIAMQRALLTLLCFMLTSCLQSQRSPTVREFPSSFRGWAVLVWGVPGHPPLPMEGGKMIERFPADGILITSTSGWPTGWATDEGYLLDQSGHRISPPVPVTIEAMESGSMTHYDLRMTYSWFFVGTPEERSAAASTADKEAKKREALKQANPGA